MNVFLVGMSTVHEEGMSDFLNSIKTQWSASGTHPEILTEVAGRLCYMSFDNPRPGGSEAYFKNILEKGHGSVLEHAVYSFIFTGVSRSLTHELIRHRHFSVSELSQRYVDRANAGFICPEIVSRRVESIDEWSEAAKVSRRAYRNLTESIHKASRKETLGAARSALLESCETKIFVTGNARCWRNFIEQRASREADREIRQLANKVLDTLCFVSPNIFGDYLVETIGDGTYSVATPNRKV